MIGKPWRKSFLCRYYSASAPLLDLDLALGNHSSNVSSEGLSVSRKLSISS